MSNSYDFNEFLLKSEDTTTVSQDKEPETDDLSSISENISTIDNRLAELQQKRENRKNKEQAEQQHPPAVNLSASPWLKSSRSDILKSEVEKEEIVNQSSTPAVVDDYSQDEFDGSAMFDDSEDDKAAFYKNLDQNGNDFKTLNQALDEDSVMEDYNVAVLQNIVKDQSVSNSILSDFESPDDKSAPIADLECT
jgi:hypothetical protein